MKDGYLHLRPHTCPRQQRVREILDRYVLRRGEVHDPLQNLLTLRVLRLDGRFDHIHPTPAPALHVTLPLQVGEYTRYRVSVDPQETSHRPDARQPTTNLEVARQYEVLDLPLQLYVNRYVTLRIYS